MPEPARLRRAGVLIRQAENSAQCCQPESFESTTRKLPTMSPGSPLTGVVVSPGSELVELAGPTVAAGAPLSQVIPLKNSTIRWSRCGC